MSVRGEENSNNNLKRTPFLFRMMEQTSRHFKIVSHPPISYTNQKHYYCLHTMFVLQDLHKKSIARGDRTDSDRSVK